MKFLIDESKVRVSDQLATYKNYLKERISALDYSVPEDFVKLPGDLDLIDSARALAQAKNPGGVKWVILVGIGGSSLGAEAVYQSLDLISKRDLQNKLVDLTVLDTVDQVDVSAALDQLKNTPLKLEEVLVIIVSKSGQTTETAVNASLVYQSLIGKFGDRAKDQMVVITDLGSPLASLAEKEGFSGLTIPEVVGGRFSIFSAAGLFPLAVCGVDVKSLAEGASLVNEEMFDQATLSALYLSEQYKSGKNIHDLFVFSKELEGIGKWYRQLLAESIGKDGVGMNPSVLVGSTDLHSQAQLIFGGPKNRVTTLISVESDNGLVVPPESPFTSLVKGVGGKTVGSVMGAIYQGTFEAYQEGDYPVMEIKLSELSAKEVGALLQFLLIQVVCLGKLLGVEAFGQPAVESYKSKTRKILSV